jgi:hypothetical protein
VRDLCGPQEAREIRQRDCNKDNKDAYDESPWESERMLVGVVTL